MPGETDFPGRIRATEVPIEANFLKLDCSKLKTTFGWHPRYGVKEAIGLTVEWCQEYEKNGDVVAVMDRQIAEMFQ